MTTIKSVTLTPASTELSCYYSQSVELRQKSNLIEDADRLNPSTIYVLQPHERLEVGKYVGDPTEGKDPSNPKYVEASNDLDSVGDSARSQLMSSNGRRPTLSAGADEEAELDEDPIADGGGAGSKPRDPPAVDSGSVREDLTLFRVVSPMSRSAGPRLTGSLYFPVHCAPVTAKDRIDPRGVPEAINAILHPNDREGWSLTTIAVKSVNVNKIPLYKIGPGAVAFRVVINAFEAAGMQYTPSNKLFNILWAKRATPAILRSLSPYQKINHFPGTWGIGRKDSLATNVGRMKRQYGASAFNIVPASWILPRDKDDVAADLEQATIGGAPAPTYIVKPSASSCGRGIKLYRGMPPIPKAGGKTYVCQRYIGNPFLVQQRKFDLRMYCVVTGFDPLKIYLFDEGLVRFAAEKYPGADKGLENTYMHLTNYSVNKTAELARASKGKSEESDDPVDIKWCLSDFTSFLRKTHGDTVGAGMWSTIVDEIHDVIIKTFLSIEAEVVTKLRSECSDPTGRQCFELYGLDLMVDSDLHVKLIEVNIMPSLATGTCLDKAVKSRMLAHMLTLARCVPYCRDAEASGGCEPPPSGAYQQGGDRYFFTGVRGAPRGSAERTNCPLISKFNVPSVKESMLTTAEALMLLEAEEELRCAGGFQRVFPTAGTSKYFPYFTNGVSRNNFLLASLMEQKERISK